MTDQPRKRVTIDAPDSATILAARHLDATEGPVQVGAIVDADTRSAITTVLRYITKAHNAPSCPDPIECGHEAALGEAQEAARRALAQRQEMAAERDQARETNRRLNQRAQQLESELAAYRRAVAQWEASERRTYVPLRTIAAIAKAAGRDIENPQWMLHYQRVEQAEAAITRIIALADRWDDALSVDKPYARALRAALDDPKPTIPAAEQYRYATTWSEYNAGRKAAADRKAAAPPADGEAREPCPHCPDSATYPRRLMDVHLAAEHPDVRAPAEHCGHLSPQTLLTSPSTECVLTPGHQGSHADDRGCRWWPVPVPSCSSGVPETEQDNSAVAELAQAIRLTREYVGTDLLPAVEGWDWYDALRRWAPELLDAMMRSETAQPQADDERAEEQP